MELTRIATRTALLMMAAWFAAVPAAAQDQAAPHEPAAHEAHGEEHFHRNALGITIGGTYESEEQDRFFTLGAEYERLFNPGFGAILAVEYINEVDAWVLVAPLVYRHRSGFRLLAGPGLELKPRQRGDAATSTRTGLQAAWRTDSPPRRRTFFSGASAWPTTRGSAKDTPSRPRWMSTSFARMGTRWGPSSLP